MNIETMNSLAADLDRGIALPASWYTDPGILAMEQTHIFRRFWQYVGHVDELARVGDYVTGSAGEIPLVVVRNEKGLSGFVNVCRHRRHLVMTGAGNCKLMQCPYHAWGYDLDGCLKAAPRSEREPGFDLTEFPLLPVRVDTYGPFVFANVDAKAPPLASYFGEIPAIMASNGLDFASLRFHHREEWRADGNWKVLLENYLECYHCPVAHPGFSTVIDVSADAYILKPFEWFSTQHAPVRPTVVTGSGAYDARGSVVRAQYYYLWPNITLTTHPGHPNLAVDVWLPDGPERSRGFTARFFGPDVPKKFVEDLAAFSRKVMAEDQGICASVQLGLRAGIPERGHILRESERLVHHFQRLLLRVMSGGY